MRGAPPRREGPALETRSRLAQGVRSLTAGADPEFLSLDDVPYPIADEAWAGYAVDASSNGKPADPVRIVSLETFISEPEDSAEALLGSQRETILPADGTVLMYGDGGAGKTTLTLDAVCSLGAGETWLELEVDRAIRSLVIENEGPRGKLKQVLEEKIASYDGALAGAIHVLDEPWSKFTLRDAFHRAAVADYVLAENLDVVVLGPLATVGMVGGGTPDEISVFEGLVRDLRSLVGRPLALWIIHHENKSGDVSGAWERVPDTLIHVQAVGNGHTRLVFRKARWSSERHGTTLNLLWSGNRSFDVAHEVARDLYAETLSAFREADEWRTAHEVARLVKTRPSEAKSVLAELTRRGDLMYETGPHGRHVNAQCYRLSGLRLLDGSDEGNDDFAF